MNLPSLDNKGTTLIEIIMVMVILGVIGGMTFQVLGSGVETYAVAKARKELYDQTRLALERMTRELRTASDVTSPAVGQTAQSITFTKANGSPEDSSTLIAFQLNGSTLQRDGEGYVEPVDLAGNIQSFDVTPEGSGGGMRLVMVTQSGGYSAEDNSKKSLFESWGYTVTRIDDDALQADFDTAASNNDVMFISESTVSDNVGTKARDLDIGIVSEERSLVEEMEFTTQEHWEFDYLDDKTTIEILDGTHYITEPFGTGSLTIYSSPARIYFDAWMITPNGDSIRKLAHHPDAWDAKATLESFDTGAILDHGQPAQNRRVQFSGMYTVAYSQWNDNLKTLLQRSLEWAGQTSTSVATMVTLEITASSEMGGTVTMRTKVHLRNVC